MSCGPKGSCKGGGSAPTRAVASSAEALAKAKAFSSGNACKNGSCGVPQLPTLAIPPPPASILLSATVAQCNNYNDPRWGVCVPESVRIARVQQRTLDESTNQYDPDARFSMYVRKFIAPCPPDPAWYKNAGKNCPLPNKPDNPVLPG